MLECWSVSIKRQKTTSIFYITTLGLCAVIYGRSCCFWFKCGLTTLGVGEVCTWGRGPLYTDGAVAFGVSVALPLWGSVSGVLCIIDVVIYHVPAIHNQSARHPMLRQDLGLGLNCCNPLLHRSI